MERVVLLLFLGGIAIAGLEDVDLFKNDLPNGTPSMRCLPSTEIWWRPESRLARKSDVWRARILKNDNTLVRNKALKSNNSRQIA